MASQVLSHNQSKVRKKKALEDSLKVLFIINYREVRKFACEEMI